MKKFSRSFGLIFLVALAACAFGVTNPPTAMGAESQPTTNSVTWKRVLNQTQDWYRSEEASRIADQVVWYQKDNGGWDKNLDMAAPVSAEEKTALLAAKATGDSTIDNNTTYTQLRFLAKVITARQAQPELTQKSKNYHTAFEKGLDYLFAAQYPNGGYPQFYPLRKGYYTHITFNDNAMIGVVTLLRDVAKKHDDFRFTDETRRQNAKTAVDKATALILKLQVKVNGQNTIWAAQYDEKSLQPAAARSFEPVSLTAGESIGIVRFLMLDEQPEPIQIAAIEAAIRWYRTNQILGIRWVEEKDGNKVVKDADAPPIWARFYQIETMKPIFSGRDGVIHYDVMQIEAERRDGYRWYVTEPNQLLNRDYPKWREQLKKNGIALE